MAFFDSGILCIMMAIEIFFPRIHDHEGMISPLRTLAYFRWLQDSPFWLIIDPDPYGILSCDLNQKA